jgi:hypothetical protein
MAARVDELRTRLMAIKRDREQQQEDQDRAVQMGAAEEPEEVSEVEDEAEEQPLRVRRRVAQAVCLVVGVVVVVCWLLAVLLVVPGFLLTNDCWLLDLALTRVVDIVSRARTATPMTNNNATTNTKSTT